jgi:uncharacterized protein (TIGR02452 family)
MGGVGSAWQLRFITCAAPFARSIGQRAARDLLQKRIHRVLAIARASTHSPLVFGAWGSGVFGGKLTFLHDASRITPKENNMIHCVGQK